MTKLATYLAVAIPFVSIDLVWLKIMGDRLYRPTLGDILTSDPRMVPAAIFYAIYPLGLLAFAVVPAQDVRDASRALLSGLVFGFFTYATYDLTNQASLRNWSTTLTVVDVAWGAALAGFSAYIGYMVATR
ncbi:DUF2177 family protein [Bradyrhizobium sp. WYCCWR 13023]|uniref:DUF2177 family protein n=1 Tax=Bradyrhizobium zhengyangense TaxID=2911009 RepID=A0A9X1UE99_9BRAD|nr:DUF2177 family protein [Bradyrhizobium zhengyangense]MCG2631798.1 DUF2177 family protein [Bradyrhizobium zhengyangense]